MTATDGDGDAPVFSLLSGPANATLSPEGSFAWTPVLSDAGSHNIIVNSHNEHIGFLADRIADVVPADWDDVSPPPPNVGGGQGKFFKGVLKTDEGLIVILDIDEVLKVDEH